MARIQKLWAFILLLSFSQPVFAEGDNSSDCEACDAKDVQQIGPGSPPFQAEHKPITLPDAKGQHYELPLPNQNIGISYKAGSGIWLKDFGPASNLYLKPNKDKLSLGLKVNF